MASGGGEENVTTPAERNALSWDGGRFAVFRLFLRHLDRMEPDYAPVVRPANLAAVTDALESLDVPHWIHGKTLLGILRVGKLLPGDHDDDVGVPEAYREIVCTDVFARLSEKGFRAIRCNDEMLTVIRDNRYVDLCFFRKGADGRIGYGGKWFPAEWFETFDVVRFAGGNRSIPARAEEFLDATYSENDLKALSAPLPPDATKRPPSRWKRVRRAARRRLRERKCLREMEESEFLSCEIEEADSVNWILRRPHLELISDGGRLRTMGEILEWLSTPGLPEEIERERVRETDVSAPFDEPINFNRRFWQTGNNYLFYCVRYGFRQGVLPYSRVNEYPFRDSASLPLFGSAYYESLPEMDDRQVAELLRKHPVALSGNAFVHGKHRACAMLGRLLRGKAYVPFFVEERVARFPWKGRSGS